MASLPEAEFQRLAPHLETVFLSKGEVLYASSEPAASVFFLGEGVASLCVSSGDGRTLQLGMGGSESVVGESPIFKNAVFIVNCAMLTEGGGYRMSPTIFQTEFDRSQVLRDLVLSRVAARITETAQTALCNQVHTKEQRLSRWLLTFADRLHSVQLPATQERIGDMLGLTRSEISRTAGGLSKRNLIEYSRGHVTINDRAGFRDKTCECYRIIRRAIGELANL